MVHGCMVYTECAKMASRDMVHGCMVYTECAKMAAVSCGTSHVGAVSSVDTYIQKCTIKSQSLM